MASTNHWIVQRTIRNFKKNLTVVLYEIDAAGLKKKIPGTEKPFSEIMLWDINMTAMIRGYMVIHKNEDQVTTIAQDAPINRAVSPGDQLKLDFSRTPFVMH